MSIPTTLFADGVLEATVRNGVARLTLAVQTGDGKAEPTGILVVPLGQLPALAGSVTRLLQEVEARARAGAAPAAPGTTPGAPEPAPELPSTFRF